MTPEAIYRVALEEIDGFCATWLQGDPTAMAAARRIVSAALDAAAKAPGLADDEKAVNVVAHDFATGTGCRLCSNRTDRGPCAPCRAYAMIALRAIDAYQRGGK